MVNNEVELIRTVDIEKKGILVRNLVNAGISYLEKWEKVPFFKRGEYGGAKEVCVIYINENYMEKAAGIMKKIDNGETGGSRHMKKIKALLDGEKKKNNGGEKEDYFLDDED